MSEWDYIVVGAGSAGCALTHELANGAGNKRILVIEAGGSDRSPFIRFPAGAIRATTMFDWGYRTQPDPSCNGATEAWTRGKVLGGSSSINTTIFVRGAHRDFDRWGQQPDQTSLPGWSAEEILPLYREYETSDQSGPLRGRSGPLHVRTVRKPHPITKAFVAAAQACGHPYNEDYNGETQAGVAYAQTSQKKGMRCSSADAFLKPLLRAGMNVRLMLDAHVEKIEIANGRAAAVSFTQNGKAFRETAQDIVLSAGAINSPQLLMLSGIGDPVELGRHGIAVAIDLPGVGRNLAEHPSLRLLYKSRIPTHNLTGGMLQKLGIAGKFLTTREGPIAFVFESVSFLKTSPSEPFEDVQVHFSPVGYYDTRKNTKIAPFPSVTVVINKSHPLGRGRIRLASGDPKDAPLIECRLLGDGADVDTLARGLEMIRQIMRTEPIASLIEEEVIAGPAVSGVAAAKAFVRDNAKTTYHPVGTCRMGTDDEAVVGPDLKVRGTDNLWIADASIMPDLISGNTNAVCMMIGKKLGKQLAARH